MFLQIPAMAVLPNYILLLFLFVSLFVLFCFVFGLFFCFCFSLLFLLYNRNIPPVPAETLFSPPEITFFSFQYLALAGNTCSSGKQMGCSLMGHSGNVKLNLYTTIFLPCYVKWLSNSVIIILMLVSRLNCQSCHYSYTGNVNRVTKYIITHIHTHVS